MFEIVKGRNPRYSMHARIFVGIVPIWLALTVLLEWLAGGASQIFDQNAALVVGAAFFFSLDFVTAMVFRIGIRGEESFNSGGLVSGAKKFSLWVVIGVGSTVWSNTFPEDPSGVQWLNPRWLAANVDLLGFLYMYAVDIISSIENVTGKNVGETGVGKFFGTILAFALPVARENLEEELDGEGS